MHQWNPQNYLKFEEERSRPSRNLLAEVHLKDAQHVVDLGCGPGNSTEFLVERYPKATIIGVDSSAEMLAAARKRLPHLNFIQADLSEWQPTPPVELLFANAVFQWIPNHLDVLFRLLSQLSDGGILAVQIPDNLDEPSHALMREVALKNRWKPFFKQPIKRETILSPKEYYQRLKPICRRLDIWHTIYYHSLEGPTAIIEWVKSTGLGPYLQKIPQEEQKAFLTEYEYEVTKAYPRMFDGSVFLRFPRLFIVATR